MSNKLKFRNKLAKVIFDEALNGFSFSIFGCTTFSAAVAKCTTQL
jgi:hypothetical protein